MFLDHEPPAARPPRAAPGLGSVAEVSLLFVPSQPVLIHGTSLEQWVGLPESVLKGPRAPSG